MSDAILSPDSFHTTLNNCIKNNGASLHTEQKKKKSIHLSRKKWLLCAEAGPKLLLFYQEKGLLLI